MNDRDRELELNQKIDKVFSQLSALSEKVSQLEQKIDDNSILLTDLYRYGKLRDLLADRNWQQADLETTRVMLEICDRIDSESITFKEIANFPCNDLRIIDRLWTKYSGDRFGFSIQLGIYCNNGGCKDSLIARDNQLLQRVSHSLGWCDDDGKFIAYNDLNFTLSAPVGALPAQWWYSPYGLKMANVFLTRLMQCQL